MAVYMDRCEEAVPFLSEAVQGCVLSLFDTVLGYFFVFRFRGDWQSAVEITEWAERLYLGLKAEGDPGFLDKAMAMVLSLRAYALKKAGRDTESAAILMDAGKLAAKFDSRPDFTLANMRFAGSTDAGTVMDAFGASAVKSVGRMMERLNDPDMQEQWKEITENGQQG